MTALQWIIKEAKILRKKSPKMEWKKAVAQASAIYASKHKGKSPVGKKHKKVAHKKAAKKVFSRKVSSKFKHPKYHLHNINTKENIVSFANIKDAKEFLQDAKERGLNVKITSTKKVGTIKRKVVRKKAAKKKPNERAVLKSIQRAVKVQKSHMGGIDTKAINDYKEILGKIRYYENTIHMYREAIKNHKIRGISEPQLKNLKLWVKTHTKLLSEYKTHARELKKHI